jgi:hypothetical protein
MESFGQSGEMATFGDAVARDGLCWKLGLAKRAKTARNAPNPQLAVTLRNCVTPAGNGAALAKEIAPPRPWTRQLANTIDSHYIGTELPEPESHDRLHLPPRLRP